MHAEEVSVPYAEPTYGTQLASITEEEETEAAVEAEADAEAEAEVPETAPIKFKMFKLLAGYPKRKKTKTKAKSNPIIPGVLVTQTLALPLDKTPTKTPFPSYAIDDFGAASDAEYEDEDEASIRIEAEIIGEITACIASFESEEEDPCTAAFEEWTTRNDDYEKDGGRRESPLPSTEKNSETRKGAATTTATTTAATITAGGVASGDAPASVDGSVFASTADKVADLADGAAVGFAWFFGLCRAVLDCSTSASSSQEDTCSCSTASTEDTWGAEVSLEGEREGERGGGGLGKEEENVRSKRGEGLSVAGYPFVFQAHNGAKRKGSGATPSLPRPPPSSTPRPERGRNAMSKSRVETVPETPFHGSLPPIRPCVINSTTVMCDVKLNKTKLNRFEKVDMLKYFRLRNAVEAIFPCGWDCITIASPSSRATCGTRRR